MTSVRDQFVEAPGPRQVSLGVDCSQATQQYKLDCDEFGGMGKVFRHAWKLKAEPDSSSLWFHFKAMSRGRRLISAGSNHRLENICAIASFPQRPITKSKLSTTPEALCSGHLAPGLQSVDQSSTVDTVASWETSSASKDVLPACRSSSTSTCPVLWPLEAYCSTPLSLYC